MEEILYLLIAIIAGCILCTLMIVIIIHNSKRINTPKENEKSVSILEENDNNNHCSQITQRIISYNSKNNSIRIINKKNVLMYTENIYESDENNFSVYSNIAVHNGYKPQSNLHMLGNIFTTKDIINNNIEHKPLTISINNKTIHNIKNDIRQQQQQQELLFDNNKKNNIISFISFTLHIILRLAFIVLIYNFIFALVVLLHTPTHFHPVMSKPKPKPIGCIFLNRNNTKFYGNINMNKMKHSLLYSLSHEHSKMALISGTFMILKYTPAATPTTTTSYIHS